jgi:aspartokinase-like uncharacterized kinase
MMMNDSGLPPVLVKLGGSLLDLKDLAARLRGLFSSLAPAPVGVVVGGGAVTDVVREWDRRFNLGEEASHRIAIRSMRVTELLVAALLPECGVAGTREGARAFWREGRPVILAVEGLLDEAAEAGVEVPRASWEVTSDSLAAWAAGFVGGRRLVLLKSVAEGGAGDVDAAFGERAGALEVEWVNLREG